MYQSSMPDAFHLHASLSESENANYPNWPHPAFEVCFHPDVITLTAWYLMLSLSWPSKEGEHADGVIQLLQGEKQIEKGQSGNEMAAAPSGLCPEGARCSEPLPGGTRTAFPTGITHRFGLGLLGTPAQKMFYFIPCIKNGCTAGRWVTVVVKGCARNKVG